MFLHLLVVAPAAELNLRLKRKLQRKKVVRSENSIPSGQQRASDLKHLHAVAGSNVARDPWVLY